MARKPRPGSMRGQSGAHAPRATAGGVSGRGAGPRAQGQGANRLRSSKGHSAPLQEQEQEQEQALGRAVGRAV